MVSFAGSGWVVGMLGSRRVVSCAALLYSTLLVGIGLAESRLMLIAALFLFGFAGNMMNIAVNTQAVGVEAMYRRTVMASFHGLWSVAGFAGAAVGTLMIANNIAPTRHFLFIMAVCWLIVAIGFRYAVREDAGQHERRPVFVLPDKSIIYLGIIAFCSMICEGTMFDWSGVYFKKIVLAEKALIGAGYMAFMFTMAGTRFVADWFSTRFGLDRILQASGMFTCCGLLLAVLFPNLVPALAG